jgi:hypothetical protein
LTIGRTAQMCGTWRRRLRPAAPLVLFASAAVLVILAVLTFALHGDSRPDDPAAGRSLPAAALADENDSALSDAGAALVPPRRRLVDVVDRDAAPPRRIRIPAIGVYAPVYALQLDSNGRMQTPRNFANTGWYEPGPEPGERGPAVITGHVDSHSGPAVFYKLRKLRRGAVIRVVRADRTVARFRVEGLERWPKAEFPTRKVFGHGHGRVSTLRLVTCSGNFDPATGHYVDNTIVYAVRVKQRVRTR